MKGHTYYTLDGKKPVPCSDVMVWAHWYEKANRTVRITKLPDGVLVSTVFLGIDHSWSGVEPVLFETMIFGGDHDQFFERYSTWEQAEAGHQRAIELIFEV